MPVVSLNRPIRMNARSLQRMTLVSSLRLHFPVQCIFKWVHLLQSLDNLMSGLVIIHVHIVSPFNSINMNNSLTQLFIRPYSRMSKFISYAATFLSRRPNPRQVVKCFRCMGWHVWRPTELHGHPQEGFPGELPPMRKGFCVMWISFQVGWEGVRNSITWLSS